ncbi:MAG: hypothetical protein ACO4CG_09630 [Prochlorothrix sp.]
MSADWGSDALDLHLAMGRFRSSGRSIGQRLPAPTHCPNLE